MNGEINNFDIVPGDPKHADIVPFLMEMAMDESAQYIFGTRDIEKITGFLRQMWLHPNTRMSHKHSYVIEDKGKAIALLTSYPGSMNSKLFLPSFFKLVSIHPGLIGYINMHLNQLYHVLFTPEAEKDEYYVFMLAVLPEYRNKKLGTKLLQFAEEKAKEAGLKECSLLVRIANVDGIRFYERNGYKKVKKLKMKPFEAYKVVKALG
jgi:ribosomal protein S18 acetylase RimI-like enzyme